VSFFGESFLLRPNKITCASISVSGSLQEEYIWRLDWIWRSWSVSRHPSESNLVCEQIAAYRAGHDSGWVGSIHYVLAARPRLRHGVQPTNPRGAPRDSQSLGAPLPGSTPAKLINGLYNGSVLIQWRRGQSSLHDEPYNSLPRSRAGLDYSVLVTNPRVASLVPLLPLPVITAPGITSQPASTNVIACATVAFNVGALGTLL